MRILGFQKMDWRNLINHTDKLCNPEFTTFRLKRKDRDWELGETVLVVYKPRTTGRKLLGHATIMVVEPKEQHGIYDTRITDDEARADGFRYSYELEHFLFYRPGNTDRRPANKLTLRWLQWFEPMILYSLTHNLEVREQGRLI